MFAHVKYLFYLALLNFHDMTNYIPVSQFKIEAFKSVLELELDSDNRWIELSNLLPWDKIVAVYTKKMDASLGASAINPRIVIGAIYVKHKLKLSDVETIETIKENPYIQYFLGLSAFTDKPVFSPSLFVEIRKRLNINDFDEINKILIRQGLNIDENFSDSEDNDTSEGDEVKPNPNAKKKGKLLMDATVADQYIRFPTDIELLNECREISENLIDTLFKLSNSNAKPRTYRINARKDYLNCNKNRNPSNKDIRKSIKKQLDYLKRNIKTIDDLLDLFENIAFPLSHKLQRKLFVIREIYRQQQHMYNQKVKRCNDRIVSIHQPHVRPIKRGKSKNKTEFGAKLGVSLDSGFARIDTLSWDAYNESSDLIRQVLSYKSLHGYYPEVVLADQIYATKENRNWLKARGIRITAKALGRAKKDESVEQKRKRKKEAGERNAVEGKFGQAKNGYELNKIKARQMKTSESWIGAIVFVTNIINLISLST